jgi:hypothetical protein
MFRTMPTEQPLQLAGTLTFADVARFQYFHANRRLWMLTVFAVLLVLFSLFGIVVVLLRAGAGSFANPGLYYVFMLCWAPFLLVNPYRAARRQYRSQQYLREPMQFRFTDDGVQLQGPNFVSKLSWVLVQRVYETRTAFLIYQAPQVAWILPKRLFSSNAEIQSWKEFVVGQLAKPELYHRPGWVGAWF